MMGKSEKRKKTAKTNRLLQKMHYLDMRYLEKENGKNKKYFMKKNAGVRHN